LTVVQLIGISMPSRPPPPLTNYYTNSKITGN
jgi:hypothetical protein